MRQKANIRGEAVANSCGHGIWEKLRVELTWNCCTWIDCCKHEVPNGNETFSGEFLHVLEEEAKICGDVHLNGLFEQVRASYLLIMNVIKGDEREYEDFKSLFWSVDGRSGLEVKGGRQNDYL